MPRVTLRERFFPLHQPADVDRFLRRIHPPAEDRPASERVTMLFELVQMAACCRVMEQDELRTAVDDPAVGPLKTRPGW
jgi:hypothetical protein